MALSTKSSPTVTVEGMERIISKIYDDLNEIISSVNSFDLSADKRWGKVGDVKIVKESDKTYTLQAKTPEGWKKVQLDD